MTRYYFSHCNFASAESKDNGASAQHQQHSINSNSTKNGKNGDLSKSEAKNNSKSLLRETTSLHSKTDALLDSAAICSQGLRSVNSSRIISIIIMAISIFFSLMLLIIICNKTSQMPGMAVFLLILLMLTAFGVWLYFLWLWLVWHNLQKNAVVATQMAIECLLEDIRKKNALQYQKTSFSCLDKGNK